MYRNPGSQFRHDRIVNDLAERVKIWHPTSKVKPFFVYPKGEIDIMQYWIEDNYLFRFNNYEIKSNPHHYRAKQQLERFEEHLNKVFAKEQKIINNFHVYGCYENTYKICRIGTDDGLEFIIGKK